MMAFSGGVGFSAGGGGFSLGRRIRRWRKWPCSREVDLAPADEACIGAVGEDAAGLFR